jgi:hypothetical protein
MGGDGGVVPQPQRLHGRVTVPWHEEKFACNRSARDAKEFSFFGKETSLSGL